METFSVTIGVGSFEGGDLGDLMEVSAIVCPGPGRSHAPGYAMLPEPMLTALGVRPARRKPIKFADGRIEMRDVGAAWITYNDDKMVCPVIFGPEGEYLLGALTPGFLSLEVDPVGKKLVPMEFLPIYPVIPEYAAIPAYPVIPAKAGIQGLSTGRA